MAKASTTSTSKHDSSALEAAEEYELSEAGPSHSHSHPDGAQPPTTPKLGNGSHQRRKSSHGKKTFTIHTDTTGGSAGGGGGGIAGVGLYDPPVTSGSGPGSGSYVLPSPYKRRVRRNTGGGGDGGYPPDSANTVTSPILHLPSFNAHNDLFLHEDTPTSHHHHPHHPSTPGPGQTETLDIPDFGNILGLTPDSLDDNYLIAQSMRSSWKRRLFLLMEEPGSSREAFTVHIVVTVGILMSGLLTILSTLPTFHTREGAIKTLFGLDTMIVVLFTVEYFARVIGHSDSLKQCWNWITSFFAIVDLLAILPFYIEVALNADTTILFRFSILRTLRLLRVFRAFKYQNQMLFTIEVMYIAIHRSKDALLALSFFLVMALVIFSTLIYFAERGTWDTQLGTFVTADGDPSQFESIPSAAWFVLVTITTVGYGEIIPRSVLGRLFTVPLLVFGLLLIALPSFVLGRNFAIVFDAMQAQLQQPQMKSALVSQRTSMERSNAMNGSLPLHNDDDPALPKPPRSDRSDSLDDDLNDPMEGGFRLADRGAMAGGNQYDAIPSEPSTSKTLDPNTSMSAAFDRPKSGQGKVKVKEPVVGSSAARDLSNAKLAMNQQVLLAEIARLSAITEQQGKLLSRVLELLEARDKTASIEKDAEEKDTA